MSRDESEKSATYYIRSRGKVVGPFTLERLKTLQARGQFSRVHEVSTDGRTWQSASSVSALFGSSSRKSQRFAAEGGAADEGGNGSGTAPAGGADEAAWYYHLGGQQHGPVRLSEIRGLVRGGRLGAGDLAWSSSLSNWTPLGEIPELATDVRGTQGMPALPAAAAAPGINQMFCFACGAGVNAQAEICPRCGVRQRTGGGSNRRNRTTAALLSFFLGGIGAHHFYLGHALVGFLYACFFVGGVAAREVYAVSQEFGLVYVILLSMVPAFIAFIEAVIFLCMTDDVFNSKYN